MKRLLLFCLALTAALNAFAWGQKGHDVTAWIAEQHLTPEAAAAIDRVLGGRSLVYYANWMDNASHTPEYAYSKTWHYLNIDEGETLESQPRHPNGDILTALNGIVGRIEKGKLSPEEEFDQLRMLIHLVGDLHCPMHAGRSTDAGGNKVPVVYFNRPANLHGRVAAADRPPFGRGRRRRPAGHFRGVVLRDGLLCRDDLPRDARRDENFL